MDVPAFQRAFHGRLSALANAHTMMLAEGGADLSFLLKNVLEPYRTVGRIEIAGPPIRLDSDAASAFSMAFHELATNASKYGALLSSDGILRVNWDETTQRDGNRTFSRKFPWIFSLSR
jgi:two-component sensor histidine kinase